MGFEPFLKDGEVYKTCNKCHKDKVVKSEFYLQKRAHSVIIRARCKECISTNKKQIRDSDKEKFRERNRKYYHNNKDHFRQYWENNKEKKQMINKIYQLKNTLGGKKLNRGIKAKRKREKVENDNQTV